MIRFANPYLLLLLVMPLLYLFLYYSKRFLKPATLGFSDIQLFRRPKTTVKVIIYHALPIIFAFSLALAIIASAPGGRFQAR